jgi:hypothetical protein
LDHLPDSALTSEVGGRIRETITVVHRKDDYFDRPSTPGQLSPLYEVIYDSAVVEPLVLTGDALGRDDSQRH